MGIDAAREGIDRLYGGERAPLIGRSRPPVDSQCSGIDAVSAQSAAS